MPLVRRLPLAVVALGFALGARAEAPSSHQRLPLQMDFDRCVLAAAEQGDANVQGHLRLELLVRKEGNVYAAFAHSSVGVDDQRLMRCLTSRALLWKLPPVPVDYQRAYELSFVPGGTELDMRDSMYWQGVHFASQGRASVFMPDINDPPKPARLDVRMAQATIDVAGWASDAERGIAQLAVHRYPEALAAFRTALGKDATDPVALRGLSQALVESGGDLGEARATAELLTQLQPASVQGNEALLRVCLAQGDDPCSYAAFKAAREAKDLEPRSRVLSELQPATEQAAVRLREQARQAQKLNPCAEVRGDRELALCLVKRCLDSGTATYAGEVHGAAGAWTATDAGEGKLLVGRPLGIPGEENEPRWIVRLSARAVRMTPVNAAARHVSLKHNRCGVAPRAVAGESEQVIIEEPVVRIGSPDPKKRAE